MNREIQVNGQIKKGSRAAIDKEKRKVEAYKERWIEYRDKGKARVMQGRMARYKRVESKSKGVGRYRREVEE